MEVGELIIGSNLDSLPQTVHSLVKPTELQIRQTKSPEQSSKHWIARAEAHRGGHMAFGLLATPKKNLNPPCSYVNIGQIGIQANGEFNLAKGSLWCPQGDQQRGATKMHAGGEWRQFRRFGHCCLGQTDLLSMRLGHVGVDFP